MHRDHCVQNERRRSDRWVTHTPIRWRCRRSRRVRDGVVTQRSLEGMVIVADQADTCGLKIGSGVIPADEPTGIRHGFRRAVVRRTGQTPRQSVLYLEILS